MSAQQGEILNKLLQLANGNASLVQQAILDSSKRGQRVPQLREVIDTIKGARTATTDFPS